jgi:hypothetical protein
MTSASCRAAPPCPHTCSTQTSKWRFRLRKCLSTAACGAAPPYPDALQDMNWKAVAEVSKGGFYDYQLYGMCCPSLHGSCFMYAGQQQQVAGTAAAVEQMRKSRVPATDIKQGWMGYGCQHAAMMACCAGGIEFCDGRVHSPQNTRQQVQVPRIRLHSCCSAALVWLLSPIGMPTRPHTCNKPSKYLIGTACCKNTPACRAGAPNQQQQQYNTGPDSLGCSSVLTCGRSDASRRRRCALG